MHKDEFPPCTTFSSRAITTFGEVKLHFRQDGSIPAGSSPIKSSSKSSVQISPVPLMTVTAPDPTIRLAGSLAPDEGPPTPPSAHRTRWTRAWFWITGPVAAILVQTSATPRGSSA